jgi:hypothetical protein
MLSCEPGFHAPLSRNRKDRPTLTSRANKYVGERPKSFVHNRPYCGNWLNIAVIG